jgi:steroid delta-isomerase-like uncharacterized protein
MRMEATFKQRMTWAAASLLAVIAVGSMTGAGRTSVAAAGVENGNVERNKEVARRWSEELWSRGNLAVADEIISAGYERHDPGDPFPARGPADVKRIVTMLRTMLPDLHIQVDAMMADGEFVISRYTSTATDTVGYMGMPPTGKSIKTSAIQIFRFADGKIVESWAARDDLGTLKQLGHWAPPAPRPTK